jgi:hypothetical protein
MASAFTDTLCRGNPSTICRAKWSASGFNDSSEGDAHPALMSAVDQSGITGITVTVHLITLAPREHCGRDELIEE